MEQKPAQWAEEKWRAWLWDRNSARTDLFWLSNYVLGHDWINEKIHRPIIDFLPRLHGGEDVFDFKEHRLMGYRPHVPLEDLNPEELRNLLILQWRGSLKTTLISQDAYVQWILNYPDIRIALVTAVGEQGQATFDGVRKSFQFCEGLRYLFPELCPPAKRAADWGNQEAFTVCNRPRNRKEPSMSLISVGKVIAGYHYDILGISDVVDVNNSRTPGQNAQVINFMGYCEPLVERYPNGRGGWKIVEGTPYDYGDYYQTIRDSEESKPPEEKSWKIYIHSARNEDGTAHWPERMPIEKLSEMERDPTIGPYIVAAQYLMNPIPQGGGLATREQIVFTPAKLIKQLLPMMNKYCTIDLAGMEENTRASNDDTVMNVAGWDNDGRLYPFDIRMGKFTPHQVIEQMFEIWTRHRIIAFKIEKDAHARVLLPFLRREMEKRNIFMTIVEIKRDNRVSKKQRIRGLQAWFQAGLIRFSDDLTCKPELINQIIRFSGTSTYHDDILDTLVDHCFSRDGQLNYDVVPDEPRGQLIPFARPETRFLGFDPVTHQSQWSDDITSEFPTPMTGM